MYQLILSYCIGVSLLSELKSISEDTVSTKLADSERLLEECLKLKVVVFSFLDSLLVEDSGNNAWITAVRRTIDSFTVNEQLSHSMLDKVRMSRISDFAASDRLMAKKHLMT
jgi:hypothetical protein